MFHTESLTYKYNQKNNTFSSHHNFVKQKENWKEQAENYCDNLISLQQIEKFREFTKSLYVKFQPTILEDIKNINFEIETSMDAIKRVLVGSDSGDSSSTPKNIQHNHF